MSQSQHKKQAVKPAKQKLSVLRSSAQGVRKAKGPGVSNPTKLYGRCPSIQGDNGKMTIKHSEFVRSLTVNGATSGPGFYIWPEFTEEGQGFDLNPGLSQTFPWLSNVAKNYERYRFNSLKIILRPKQSTLRSGWIMGAVDYDYSDAVPADKRSLLTNHSVAEASTYVNFELPVDVKRLTEGGLVGGWRYILNTTSPIAEGDPRLSMAGFVVFATDGLDEAIYSWDVWAVYDVTLDIERPPMETISYVTPYAKGTDEDQPQYSWAPFDSNAAVALPSQAYTVNFDRKIGSRGPFAPESSRCDVAEGVIAPWKLFRFAEEFLGSLQIEFYTEDPDAGLGLIPNHTFAVRLYSRAADAITNFVLEIPSYHERFWNIPGSKCLGLTFECDFTRAVWNFISAAGFDTKEVWFSIVQVAGAVVSSAIQLNKLRILALGNGGAHRYGVERPSVYVKEPTFTAGPMAVERLKAKGIYRPQNFAPPRVGPTGSGTSPVDITPPKGWARI